MAKLVAEETVSSSVIGVAVGVGVAVFVGVPVGVVPPEQGLAVVAILRGTGGETTSKSARLLSVSMQPPFLRTAPEVVDNVVTGEVSELVVPLP